jgi:protein-S-isoprenylcysteine O-methyltransferase Ste14
MVPDAIVTAAIGLIFLSILVSGVVLKRKGKDFAGEDPVHPALYRIGKACSFLVWMVLFTTSIRPGILKFVPALVKAQSVLMRVISAALAVFAAVLIISSFFALGVSLKFGLPRGESGSLKRNGLYRFSRNPMYLGFALLDAAAVLFIPSIFVLVPSVVAIYVHHRIVLAEEAHMVKTWGDEYMKYMKTVRRYV